MDTTGTPRSALIWAASSGSRDKTVRVWDLATGAPIGQPLTGHTSFVKSVATAQLDGDELAGHPKLRQRTGDGAPVVDRHELGRRDELVPNGDGRRRRGRQRRLGVGERRAGDG